jgi:hypothetical protein
MKTEKKLKRGLAELSHLFVPEKSSAAVQPIRAVSFQITSPDIASVTPMPKPVREEAPELICASFIRLSPFFRTGDFIALLEQARPVFSETCLLAVAPNENHLQEFSGLFSLPEQDIRTGALHDVGRKMSLGCLEEAEIRELTHPHPPLAQGHVFKASKKALVVLDSPLAYQPGQPLAPADGYALDVLDHCVFIVEADLSQMAQAYQLIRLCSDRNPLAHLSIFLVGPKVEANSELVYDRLSLMVSRFLGCDLGFLGWADSNEMHFNPELLLEEGGHSIRFSSKAHLNEALFSSLSA